MTWGQKVVSLNHNRDPSSMRYDWVNRLPAKRVEKDTLCLGNAAPAGGTESLYIAEPAADLKYFPCGYRRVR